MSLSSSYRSKPVRRVICFFLSFVMAAPVTLFGSRSAYASDPTNPPETETKSCTPKYCSTGECKTDPLGAASQAGGSPESAEEGSKTSAEVAMTCDPINLRRGSVAESEVDLMLPGPVGSLAWSHSRTYDSGHPGSPDGRNLFWQGGQTGPRLSIGSGGDIEIRPTSSNVLSCGVGGSGITPPADYPVTITSSGAGPSERYTIEEHETGKVLVYYGANTSIPAGTRGRLYERSSREYRAAGLTGIRYYYRSDGQVRNVLTAEPQLRRVDYSYTPIGGDDRVDAVTVRAGGLTGDPVTHKVEYTYYDEVAANPALGKSGDLVQVKVSMLASDGASWITRTTQYRYHTGGSEGSEHQLKMVLEPDAVERARVGNSESGAEGLLSRADSDVEAYASRSFTYYTADASTAALITQYGGSEFDEYDSTHAFGVVKTETIGGCSGCGGGSTGITKTYAYLNQVAETTTDPNAVIRIVVEDTEDRTGSFHHRRLWGLNYRSAAIRKAFIAGTTATSTNVWCTSTRITNPGLRVSEERMPSAHAPKVVNDEALKKFLNPTSGTPPGRNDADTVSPSSGVVYYHEYEAAYGGSAGFRTGKRVGEGAVGVNNAHYVSATDWGDATLPVDDEQPYLPVARYTYPAKTTTRNDPSRIKSVAYSYDFHDSADKQIKLVTMTLPAVPTGQNGSGAPTVTYQYFDEEGRLRWTRDGEGYTDYYSYHPGNGKAALTVVDAGTAGTLDGDITGNGGGDWVAWAGAAPTELARGTGLPTPLTLKTKLAYDGLGRIEEATDAGGQTHLTRYFSNGVARFSYVDSGSAALPPSATIVNDGGVRTEMRSFKASVFLVGATTIPSDAADYTSRTVYGHDAVEGKLEYVDRYHNASGSTRYDDFYRTSYLYDDYGRRAATIDDVEAGRFQVSAMLYDDRGRVVETRRGVATTKPIDYDTLDNLITGSESGFAGWAKASETTYDYGGPGDGYATSTKRYYGTGAADYVETLPKYTFRGHVRGADTTNGGTSFGPYRVTDIDWMGRPVASAIYSSAPAWPTDYAAYVTANASGRYGMAKASYDDLGRVYQTQTYPGPHATAHFVQNSYYDRNGRLVASEDPHGVTTEYAYDGADRLYQARVATTISSGTPYSSGAFTYNAPLPKPEFDAISGGGSGGLIELNHSELDADGNVIESHTVELNHDDTDGFSLASGKPDGGVRTSTLMWYDAADRLTTSAYYGCGSDSDSVTAWQSADAPGYGTEPTASGSNVLVSTYAYDTAGRQASMTDPKGTTTKSFYDDLGRRTYTVENASSDPGLPTSGAGGGVNDEEDRIVRYEYNGLGGTTKLTAYNAGADNQETEYFYEHAHDASLATKTVYPDGNATDDCVTTAYHLDGSINTRTDQRGVVMEYGYDDARRPDAEYVTSFGTSNADQTIKAITRKYDDYGRLHYVTSHSSAEDAGDNGSGGVNSTNAVNQIKYVYSSSNGRLTRSEQEHDGAVDGSTLAARYNYDTSTASSVFTDGLRLSRTYYPGLSSYNQRQYFGLDDRLGRPSYVKLHEGNLQSGSSAHTVRFEYNGAGRLAEKSSDGSFGVNAKLSYTGGGAGSYDGWDRFGRVVRQEWKKGSTSLDKTTYTYDTAGNRLSRTVDSGTTYNYDHTYTYDGLHRLKTVDADGTTDDRRWTLDQLGNWDEVHHNTTGSGPADEERSHNAANEITGFPTGGPASYDKAGNMTVAPAATSEYSSLNLKYDAWNRVVQVERSRLPSKLPDRKYRYDGLHRRVSRGGATGVDTHFYYNESWQVLTETDGSYSATAIYAYGADYIDAVAVRVTPTDEHFFTHDALYNVTAAVERSSEAVVERYAYSAYGKPTILDADYALDSTADDGLSDIGNELLFTGRRTDPETGLQLNRYRFYQAPLGRWVSRDPIGTATVMSLMESIPRAIIQRSTVLLSGYVDSYNFYMYVGGKPLSTQDPSGLCPAAAPCPQSHPGQPTYYGCYCGENNGWRIPMRPPVPKPIDDMDAGCSQHDLCYRRHQCKAVQLNINDWPPFIERVYDNRPECIRCDKEFCQALRNASCIKWAGPIPFRPDASPAYRTCDTYRRLAMITFRCSQLLGSPAR